MEVLIGWKCSILSYSNDKIERRKEDSKRVSFLLRVRLDSITCYLKKSCELHKDAKQRSRTKRKAAGIDENIPSGKFHRFYFREVKRKCINAQTMRIFVFYTPRKSGCSTLVRKFPFFFFFSFFPLPSLLVQSLETGNREPDCLLEEDTRCWPSFCKCARSRWHYRGESISQDIPFASCKRKTDVTFLIRGFYSIHS